MKKQIILIYAIISMLLFAIFPSVATKTTYAASSNRVVIVTDSKIIDNSLIVDVTIQENPGLVGCVLEVLYDRYCFNQPIVQFSTNAGLKNLSTESGLIEEGKCKILYEGLSGANVNDFSTGKLFTLTFNAKSTLQNGNYNITIKPEQNSVYGLGSSGNFIHYSIKDKNLVIKGVINLVVNNGSTNIETNYYTQEDSYPNLVIIIVVVILVFVLVIGVAVFCLFRLKTSKRADWKLIDK